MDYNEVKKARFKEIGYIHDKAVYKKIPRAEVQARGLKVLPTRETWRTRPTGAGFVAMEFNTSHMDGLFAATRPLEALKLLMSDAATEEKCPGSAFKEETKAIQ